MPIPERNLIRIVPLLPGIADVLVPKSQDNLSAASASRSLEPDKAQTADRDAAERLVAPQADFGFPRCPKWILKLINAKQAPVTCQMYTWCP